MAVHTMSEWRRWWTDLLRILYGAVLAIPNFDLQGTRNAKVAQRRNRNGIRRTTIERVVEIVEPVRSGSREKGRDDEMTKATSNTFVVVKDTLYRDPALRCSLLTAVIIIPFHGILFNVYFSSAYATIIIHINEIACLIKTQHPHKWRFYPILSHDRPEQGASGNAERAHSVVIDPPLKGLWTESTSNLYAEIFRRS